MGRENRDIKTFRVIPSVIEKMEEMATALSKETPCWGGNPHTNKLGFWRKGKVTKADILEIAVLKLYDDFVSMKM